MTSDSSGEAASESPAVLHVSPHPDDELLGAAATLMSLRDQGWRIVNLGCSLGRPEDGARRAAELAEACRRAGFELVVPVGLPPIGADDDLELARSRLAQEIASAIASCRAELIIGPSHEDAHHGHVVVGQALLDAVQAHGAAGPDRAGPVHVMFWGLWRELAEPNVLVPYSAPRLDEIRHALAAHAGELARNRFERLLEGRAMASAVLGPERVFGFGSPGIAEPYAELLHHVAWSSQGGWRPTRPRIFDASAPLGA